MQSKLKTVIIDEEFYTFNSKSELFINSSKGGKLIKNYHNMDWADCFQYYNSTILEYIGSRI